MRVSYAASGKVGLVSVHLCDSGHRASTTSPSLLGACMYRTRSYGVLSSSRCWCRAREHVDPRGSRLEYVQRVLVSYNTAAAAVRTWYIVVAHIPVSLLNCGGVACRILFTSIANSPKSWWEGNLVFYAEGRYIFKNVLSQILYLFLCVAFFSLSVCAFFTLLNRSFYPSTSSTPSVRADSSS